MSFQNSQLAFAGTSGNVQSLDAGYSDNGSSIFFELETQEIEFGNRAHLKKIADKVGVSTRFGAGTSFKASVDDGDYKEIPMNLERSPSIGTDINLEGHFFSFLWSGNTKTNQPGFLGFYLEDISDIGFVKS